jgi:hypothetical protein
MSKEYTAVPQRPIAGDEKTDLELGSMTQSGQVDPTSLKMDTVIVPPEKKVNPVFIISLWIVMSSSVIGECYSYLVLLYIC